MPSLFQSSINPSVCLLLILVHRHQGLPSSSSSSSGVTWGSRPLISGVDSYIMQRSSIKILLDCWTSCSFISRENILYKHLVFLVSVFLSSVCALWVILNFCSSCTQFCGPIHMNRDTSFTKTTYDTALTIDNSTLPLHKHSKSIILFLHDRNPDQYFHHIQPWQPVLQLCTSDIDVVESLLVSDSDAQLSRPEAI